MREERGGNPQSVKGAAEKRRVDLATTKMRLQIDLEDFHTWVRVNQSPRLIDRFVVLVNQRQIYHGSPCLRMRSRGFISN